MKWLLKFPNDRIPGRLAYDDKHDEAVEYGEVAEYQKYVYNESGR